MSPEDLVRISGGEFTMGQGSGRDEERPEHRVSLTPFRICRYQVTNADYDAFCRATTGERAAHRDLPEFCDPALPVVAVSWFDAVAFCEWQSAQWGLAVRLPTEAEWEFAARGGFAQRLYPWGDELPAIAPERWAHGPEPVGRGEPNGYGLFDFCQNVHEWCSDWYDPAYYSVSPAENPAGPEHGVRRASRGGAWRHHIKVSRCAARSSIPPEFRYLDYGFRIAAD
jgi:formylglycine-generating enzyme required for sulfatase activity